MVYAQLQDVEAGFRILSDEERSRCTALLSEAAIIIDNYNADADPECKLLPRADTKSFNMIVCISIKMFGDIGTGTRLQSIIRAWCIFFIIQEIQIIKSSLVLPPVTVLITSHHHCGLATSITLISLSRIIERRNTKRIL